MKYFLDTEFIEGFHKPLFGKRRHFIDLISIGIVREDGREYYAISNEFNPNDADKWVKENVISKLPRKSVNWSDQGGDGPRAISESLLYKPNSVIANEVRLFFGCYEDSLFWRAPPCIEVYGYYSDYDWVLLCSLFGRMIDLPKGFPMFCIDLKQELDNRIARSEIRAIGYEAAVTRIKNHAEYPQQQDEHNALSDAIWNKKLYDFIKQLSPCHLLS